MTKPRICVIGGGVIGLPSALRILEELKDVEVAVIAEELSPYTTGDGSAGWVRPYLLGGTPKHLVKRWCTETMEHLMEISRTQDGERLGVYTTSGYDLSREKREIPDWSEWLINFREMSQKELQQFPDYRYGFTCTTLTAECKKYLPWIMQRFINSGGHCIQRKVLNLAELIFSIVNKLASSNKTQLLSLLLYGKYDIIVNCTGIGARDLLGDKEMVSLRGQIIRVEAPWIKHFVEADDDELYILLSSESITLGGTSDRDVPHKEISADHRQRIWEGCCRLVPSLRNARIITEWVGFRPGRSSIRLEKENYHLDNGKTIPVVHNYGHGGSGVTLHWGCAGDTVKLVREILQQQQQQKQQQQQQLHLQQLHLSEQHGQQQQQLMLPAKL